MKDRYLTVKDFSQNEIIIEKSKFICSVKRVNNEDEAKEFVAFIRGKYPDATHNCYAYIADENGFYIKFSDDGEPQGTAGMPMLEVLKNKKLFCTATVVTRYFGGVKLGAGGLVRAYADSVVKGVEKCGIIEKIYSNIVSVSVNFSIYPKILKYFNTITCTVINSNYNSDGVDITFAIPFDLLDKVKTDFADFTSGKANVEVLNSDYIVYGDKRL